MEIFEHLSSIPFFLVTLGFDKIISTISRFTSIHNSTKVEGNPNKLYWVHSMVEKLPNIAEYVLYM